MLGILNLEPSIRKRPAVDEIAKKIWADGAQLGATVRVSVAAGSRVVQTWAWVTREQIEDGMLMDVDIGFRSVANSISPTAGAPKRLTRPLPHHRCFVAAMGNGASAATAMAASVPWLKSHLGLAETLEPMEKMVRSFFS